MEDKIATLEHDLAILEKNAHESLVNHYTLTGKADAIREVIAYLKRPEVVEGGAGEPN